MEDDFKGKGRPECGRYGREKEGGACSSDVPGAARKAQRKVEQLDVLNGVVAVFAIGFFGITAWLELKRMPALAMALALLVLVVAFFLLRALSAKARREAMRAHNGSGNP